MRSLIEGASTSLSLNPAKVILENVKTEGRGGERTLISPLADSMAGKPRQQSVLVPRQIGVDDRAGSDIFGWIFLAELEFARLAGASCEMAQAQPRGENIEVFDQPKRRPRPESEQSLAGNRR